jgi:ubiquinol-cytochrome c reductase cytochrome c1 subunit
MPQMRRVFTSSSSWRRVLIGAGVAGVGTAVASANLVLAEGIGLHAPHYHWSHNEVLGQLDMKSVRRGYEVYKQVCSACHAMKYMCYRHLVNNTHTEDEAKAEAAAVMVEDGPDEKGQMFMRPGKLSDTFPNAYPNEESARAANNGAYPPDLTLMANARHGGEDYIFALLTGYYDAPAGVEISEDQHYNVYFPGEAIGMIPPLYDEILEYSDGTPATLSQLAKDVTTFIRWTSNPEFNLRKALFVKVFSATAAVALLLYAFKRRKWSILKSRKSFLYDPKTGNKTQ